MGSATSPILQEEVSIRRLECERRYKLVVNWLELTDLDGVLLLEPPTIAWLTAGMDLATWSGPGRDLAGVWVTRHHRIFVVTAEPGARFLEQEAAQLGFEVESAAWSIPPTEWARRRSGGKKIAADRAVSGFVDRGLDFVLLRSRISSYDLTLYRKFAEQVATTVELALHEIEDGESRRDLASRLAQLLVGVGIEPILIRMYGHRSVPNDVRPNHAPVGPFCSVLLTARHRGMVFAVSRAVAFREVSVARWSAYRSASALAATMLRFSTADVSIAQLFAWLEKSFAQMQIPLDQTGFPPVNLIGYQPNLLPIDPNSAMVLSPGVLLAWVPIIGGVPAVEAGAAVQGGVVPIAPTGNWPEFMLMVGEVAFSRPDILIR